MIIFLLSVAIYLGVLFFIKPSPASLKSAPMTYRENLGSVWASMVSGVFILLVFFLTTNYSFVTVDEDLYGVLALSNDSAHFFAWPWQAITHLFIHNNLIHLAANLTGIALASVYERRVGAKRFFMVLIVGGVASIPSVFFYAENIAISGISGGVFGLAAAYFTDEERLSTKNWLTAIGVFLFFALLLMFDTELRGNFADAFEAKIDHLGHFFGAFGAILYCRLFPVRLSKSHSATGITDLP